MEGVMAMMEEQKMILESESQPMSPIKQLTPALKKSCMSIEDIENMN